ncbi:MAG: hypothetical protein V3T70_03690, partial [Phycisphaerae bacterium]
MSSVETPPSGPQPDRLVAANLPEDVRPAPRLLDDEQPEAVALPDPSEGIDEQATDDVARLERVQEEVAWAARQLARIREDMAEPPEEASDSLDDA